MPRQRAELPPELRDIPFTVADATALGVGSKRLRGSDLVTPVRGTRLTPEADGLIARCRAYALHRGTDFDDTRWVAALLSNDGKPVFRKPGKGGPQ